MLLHASPYRQGIMLGWYVGGRLDVNCRKTLLLGMDLAAWCLPMSTVMLSTLPLFGVSAAPADAYGTPEAWLSVLWTLLRWGCYSSAVELCTSRAGHT